jgi:hypothetical protein
MTQLTEAGMNSREKRFSELMAGLKEERKLARQFRDVLSPEGHETYLHALDTILAKLDIARAVMAPTTARIRFERENRKRRRPHMGADR